MRRLLFLALLAAGSSFAMADSKANNVFGDLSVTTGGLKLGGGYEYIYNGAQGVGGQLQIFQKDSNKGANGYLVLGAFTGYHFFKGTWDFALAPGLNLINISAANPKNKDATTLGPSIQVGLTEQLNDRVSLGFDWANYYVWFSDDYRGTHISSLDFRVKVGF